MSADTKVKMPFDGAEKMVMDAFGDLSALRRGIILELMRTAYYKGELEMLKQITDDVQHIEIGDVEHAKH